MRRTAWIWLVGSIVWAGDGLIAIHGRNMPQAELGFGLALLFFIAWLFYRQSPR